MYHFTSDIPGLEGFLILCSANTVARKVLLFDIFIICLLFTVFELFSLYVFSYSMIHFAIPYLYSDVHDQPQNYSSLSTY
jgi:hypothetical protein